MLQFRWCVFIFVFLQKKKLYHRNNDDEDDVEADDVNDENH